MFGLDLLSFSLSFPSFVMCKQNYITTIHLDLIDQLLLTTILTDYNKNTTTDFFHKIITIE